MLVRFQPRQPITPGGEIESRLAYTQKSDGQNLPGRPAFAELWLGKPLPRSIIRSAPVSDTGGPGAKPGEAANFRAPFPTTNKHLIARSAMAVCKHFMSDILKKTIVLVLNRNWQAINIRTPQDAFCQMATNVATALDIELGDDASAEALRPVKWDEWITLPVRAHDASVRTARGAIRVPT